VQQRESDRAEKASLVRQEPLQLSTGRVYRLPDLHVKPPLAAGAKGSKMQGSLEAHVNGFRYNVRKGSFEEDFGVVRARFEVMGREMESIEEPPSNHSPSSIEIRTHFSAASSPRGGK
jgi:hypothetical protein